MLVQNGHTCDVEHDAGLGAGFSDQDYQQAGARIVYSSHEVFGRAELLLKVARPLQDELEWLPTGSTIAGLLHLAASRQDKIDHLLNNDITSIAYEQIRMDNGNMPVLRPLSQIGGRLSAQIAARLLQNNAGGKGILMGGVPGVPPAEVVIIGAGVVGTCAARSFLGMGAHVTVLDTDISALQRFFELNCGAATMVATPLNLARVCSYADVVVAAILIRGERPPVVITREMLRLMKPRSLVMDISIDQGGCIETSRPTNHEEPTFVEEGVIHYCVPNIPSVVARTATYAFFNAAFPYILQIANQGVDVAVQENSALQRAVNTLHGELYNVHRLSPQG